jgi:hypothetical protein
VAKSLPIIETAAENHVKIIFRIVKNNNNFNRPTPIFWRAKYKHDVARSAQLPVAPRPWNNRRHQIVAANNRADFVHSRSITLISPPAIHPSLDTLEANILVLSFAYA